MNYKHLGQNIQTVRKLKRMKQQELADAIGINFNHDSVIISSHRVIKRVKVN